jgi:putative ABC transport system substrate-binding protein
MSVGSLNGDDGSNGRRRNGERRMKPGCTRLATLGAVLVLAATLNAGAQQPEKVYRVGFLGASPPPSVGWSRTWGALVQGLRDLGYVEGRNLVIEARYSEGRDERLPGLANELVRLNVDVIVAGATASVHAARNATAAIPIVMTNHSDPVGTGLVVSLSRPGGNVTGRSIMHAALTAKRVELLKETIARITRVAVLWNPANQLHPRMLDETVAAARTLGLHVQRAPARGLEDYDSAFMAIVRDRAEALIVLSADLPFWFHRTRINELASRHRLPTMHGSREEVESGGLMGYGANLSDTYRGAATYVHRILTGANPGDLPIQQPTSFELVVNLKTAKALGLTIPTSVLVRADQVIQ